MKTSIKNFIILFFIFAATGCSGVDSKNSNTITVWHWLSDRDDAFQELAARFEAETQTKVKFELFAPSEAYTQRVKASAQTNTLPDIYGILGEKRDFASFIRSGFVANLTPELAADDAVWKKSFHQKALAVSEFLSGNEYGIPDGIYGVPLDVTNIQMLYNKKLYAKAGLEPVPPRSWEEWVAHCRAMKAAGIPCFVSGFGEIWMIEAFASNQAMNIMGEEKVFQTYQGKVPYTDPDWLRVLSLFKQMADEEILVEGAVTMVNKTAEQTFANERAAYAFNGSWGVNVYRGMNPRLEYGAFPPPPANPSRPMKIWGGSGTSFVVNNASPRREAAIRFLQWLTEPAQQAYLASQTLNLPAVKVSAAEIPPVLAEFADDMEIVTHPNLYPANESPLVSEAFSKGVQSILIGEKTPQEVAEEIQRLKEKELKKAK